MKRRSQPNRDRRRRVLTISLPRELVDEIDEVYLRRAGVPRSRLIEGAVTKWLEQEREAAV